jgi:hypothetical protein
MNKLKRIYILMKYLGMPFKNAIKCKDVLMSVESDEKEYYLLDRNNCILYLNGEVQNPCNFESKFEFMAKENESM